MRNDTGSVTTMDSTTGTTVTSGIDVSFVNVPRNVGIPALQATIAPKHDTIGLHSQMSTTQVCVTMTARDLPEDDGQRAPVDIVVALDVSSSMSGGKLELSKKTLSLLLRTLHPGDRFGLITYSSNANIEIPVQKMTKTNKDACDQKIQGLMADGSTNISAAIGLALQELYQIDTPNEVQTVFLLTDGEANVGICDMNGLVELTRNFFLERSVALEGTDGAEDQPTSGFQSWNPFRNTVRSPKVEFSDAKPNAISFENNEARNPITLHCFGYGCNHESDLLRGMANVVPGGSYYFVESDVNVGSAFGNALGGILSVVAQNATVLISVPDDAKAAGVEIVDVFHNRKIKRDNGSYSVVVGDFYGEEVRDVVFEVKLAQKAGIGGNDPIPHVLVNVSYTDTLNKTPGHTESLLCCISRPETSAVSRSNSYVDGQWLRIMTTKAMKEANDKAQNRDFEGAKSTLEAAKTAIRAAVVSPNCDSSTQEMLQKLSEDIDELRKGFSSYSMYQSGKHCYTEMQASHTTQRCMSSMPIKSTYYAKKSQKKMKNMMNLS